MKFKRVIVSIVLALVMTLSMALPVSQAFPGGQPGQQPPKDVELKIHKLKLKKLPDKPIDTDGKEISLDDLKDKLGQTEAVTGLAGVKFKYWKIESADRFDKLMKDKPTTEEAVKNILEEELTVNGITIPAENPATKETAFTDANGLASVTIEANDKNAHYYFIESEKPSTLTGTMAVPFGITLPIYDKDNGDEMTKVHIYPKNTTDNPTVVKERVDKKDGFIGQDKNYKVKTMIPAGSNYERLIWSDSMEKGLTFNKDAGVKIEVTDENYENPQIKFNLNEHYELKSNDSGFELKFNDTGLAAFNELTKKGNVHILLSYSAKINKEAEIATDIDNHVIFKFGRKPAFDYKDHSDNITPNAKQITVTKNWTDDAPENPDTNPPKTAKVTYYLYKVGKEGAADKVVAKVVKNAPDWNHTFTKLEDNEQYYVKEFVDGYDAEYVTDAGNGAVTIKNHKTPDVIQPDPVQVITYGKKFVKTSEKEDIEYLQGAEFKVYRNKGDGKNEFLKAVTKEDLAVKKEAYDSAQEDYITEAAKPVDQQEDLEAKKTARDEAYKNYKGMGGTWEWTNDETKAYVFISGGDGKFEVMGLEEGTYYLKEVKAPEGYANLQDDVEFKVNDKSHQGSDVVGDVPGPPHIDGALRIKNRKILIPQAGGIGTAIFTGLGITLMAGAFIALKRNNKVEEE